MGDPVSRPRLLIGIVEDDPAVLNSLEFALQVEGYAVCSMTSAAEASTNSHVLNADCLVLDYALPDDTGVALLGALRGRGLVCPAIVIASNPSKRCIEECHAAGVPLVEKPLMGEELSAQIRAALASSGRSALGARIAP